jgi:superfamily II DNA or RNA helicase
MGEVNQEVLAAGTAVRLKSDPGRQGVTTGRTRQQAGILKYQVGLPEGRSWYPDYELEVIDDEPDWEELLSSGRFGRVRDLRRNITHIHLSGRLANLVYSMDATNTDFYAYQYKPVLSFLDSPSRGLLIADEVGLGKTIEAGLIWTELRARYDARRLLVVCPAMLREKWKSELAQRFGIDAEILDAKDLYHRLQVDKHNESDGRGIVCSLQGLRPPSTGERKKGSDTPRAKLREFLDQKAVEEPLFDLVIIDEAHYLRNPETQSAKLGQLLRDVTENLVLLSATPINLSDEDLFQLLNLVDPDSFAVKEVFPKVLSANQHLQKARDLALDPRSNAAQIKEELETAKAHPLLMKNRQLEELVTTDLLDGFLAQKSDRIRLANRIEKINLLRHAITRTKKSEVHDWQVVREPVKKFVELDQDGPEWAFYKMVSETIQRYAWEGDISDGFLLAGPQRQVSSCMYAAAKAWKEKDYSVEEQYYEDFGLDSGEEHKVGPLIERLCREVLPNVDLHALRANDSKYEQFRNTILGYLDQHPDEKVIVFSFYRNTLAYLAERLREDGIVSQVLVGGMKEPKHEVIERFRDRKELRVLLSSEVASEGVDLQFSRVVVNYDLPWNPMKVEQRIGRIDRLGQKSEKITIVNLFYANTIDHKIHDKLYERLKIFERALGGMEAILGEKISELTSELLSRPLSDEEVAKRVSRTAMAIERMKVEQDELEKQASNLIAHGGYILDEVQAAHQFKKRITETDLISYVKDYFEKYSKGYEFHQLDPEGHQFEIRLSPELAAQLDEYIRKNKLFGQTRLATGETLSCLFANKVRDIRGKKEVISQFHPLVRFIGHQLTAKNEAFYRLIAATVPLEKANGLAAGHYGFFVSRWSFSGVRVEEELRVRAINLETQVTLSAEESWNLVNLARVEGEDWIAVDNVIDRDAFLEALYLCNERLDLDFERARREKTNENEDRVSFQIESAQRHRDRQLGSREQVLQRHRERGNTKAIPLEVAKIRKINERFEVQVEKLRQKSLLNSSSDEVCCGAILAE